MIPLARSVPVRPVRLPADPLIVAHRWPKDRPLVMVHSVRPDPRWSRWSILAEPVERVIWREGEVDDPVAAVDAVLADRAIDPDDAADGLPFLGGWIGCFSYDLGRVLEPAVGPARAADDRGWPLIDLAWCPNALVCDRLTGRWHAIGDAPHIEPGRPRPFCQQKVPIPFFSLASDQYVGAVERAIEYIRAGDIFQANITRRVTLPWEGAGDAAEARALAWHALRTSGAWYGAYLELSGNRQLISLSPELFLSVDARTRRIVTRPIKGTRPTRTEPRELLESAKDAAELHMIVDLMRNDLGRVCEFGSITVPNGRTIETHPTVHHGVGEVAGTLRPDVTFGGLLAATFPGGSVTGAPKIRAMQIIDELEPVRRGPYCGAVGFISRHGHAVLNIAIRTLMLGEGRLDYGAGCGIVADSIPEAELRECEDKAAVLWAAVGGGPAPEEKIPEPVGR